MTIKIEKEIKRGSRSVLISNQNTAGIFASRTWLCNGTICGTQSAEHKTLNGAIKWANRILRKGL